jgi:hypothetical protein
VIVPRQWMIPQRRNRRLVHLRDVAVFRCGSGSELRNLREELSSARDIETPVEGLTVMLTASAAWSALTHSVAGMPCTLNCRTICAGIYPSVESAVRCPPLA